MRRQGNEAQPAHHQVLADDGRHRRIACFRVERRGDECRRDRQPRPDLELLRSHHVRHEQFQLDVSRDRRCRRSRPRAHHGHSRFCHTEPQPPRSITLGAGLDGNRREGGHEPPFRLSAQAQAEPVDKINR